MKRLIILFGLCLAPNFAGAEVPFSETCQAYKNYVVTSPFQKTLKLANKNDQFLWCQFFHSYTCNQPLVTFVKEKKIIKKVYWYKNGTLELFVEHPGHSSCRIYKRKKP
jgi:hypothetical protein